MAGHPGGRPRRAARRCWPPVLVVGLGVEAKPQVGLVAAVMAASLIAIGPRSLLRSRWAAGGALRRRCAGRAVRDLAAAARLAAAGRRGQHRRQPGGRAGRLLPLPARDGQPRARAGLGRRAARPVPPCWAGGACGSCRSRTARWPCCTSPATATPTTSRASIRCCSAWARCRPPSGRCAPRAARALLVCAVVLSAAISSVIALPLLPERDLQGSVVMALNPAQGETVGWPRFVRTVVERVAARSRRRNAVTPRSSPATTERRARSTCSAARPASRPPTAATTGSANGAMPPATDTHALLVGFNSAADAAPDFARCRTLATVDNGVGLGNQEQGLPVMLCSPSAPWPTLWPRLRHYD